MVRQVGTRPLTSRKAALAILAGSGILLWHLLACTESPMAFSPDGKSLAFVTMEPYEGNDDVCLAGPYDYRLMVAGNQKDLRVIEETTNAMLTAPAYNSDGSQFCYVRIPLLSKPQLQQLEEASTEAQKRWQEGTRQATTEPASQPATTEASLHTDDLTLPDLEKTMALVEQVTTNPPAAAELVIRRAGDYSVVKTVPLDLHGIRWKTSKEPPDLYMAYLTLRPQYSADGQWIYLCVGGALMAINPDQMSQRILAAPATSAVLSPDGQTIAFLQEPAIGLMRTDGSKATYVRWNGAPSLSGLAWVDSGTLAILSEGPPAGFSGSGTPATSESAEPMTISFMRTDGTVLSSPRIVLPTAGDDDKLGELAISNDGRHMVVSFQHKVYFLDGGGRIVNRIELADQPASQPGAQRGLVQPTFSPDSRSVAFKSMTGDKEASRTDAIVFFRPDGKEISRLAIPPIGPSATRPADDTTQPASRASR